MQSVGPHRVSRPLPASRRPKAPFHPLSGPSTPDAARALNRGSGQERAGRPKTAERKRQHRCMTRAQTEAAVKCAEALGKFGRNPANLSGSQGGAGNGRERDGSASRTMADGSQGSAPADDSVAAAPGTGTLVRHVIAGPGLDRSGHGGCPGEESPHHWPVGIGLRQGRADGPDIRADRRFPLVLGKEQRDELMGAWIPEGRELSSGCSRLLRPESGVHKVSAPSGAPRSATSVPTQLRHVFTQPLSAVEGRSQPEWPAGVPRAGARRRKRPPWASCGHFGSICTVG